MNIFVHMDFTDITHTSNKLLLLLVIINLFVVFLLLTALPLLILERLTGESLVIIPLFHLNSFMTNA